MIPLLRSVFVWAGILVLVCPWLARAETVTTTVTISVCGDAQVSGTEFCDDGTNTGLYSTSTANRNCTPDCSAWAPYCGDAILQPTRAEECDDGNNTSGDRCSAVCKIEDIPPSPPPGGGGGPFPGGGFNPPKETRVNIQGKAYPNATVHVLKDGDTIGEVEADPKADFFFTTAKVAPGVATFGFWAEDSGGLKSVALTTTLTVISGAVTTISGAFVPPTITIDKRKVNKGEVLNISGHSAPNVTVVTHVNSEKEVTNQIATDLSGGWKLAFDTAPLADENFHTAQAHFETKAGATVLKSSLSQSISFYVGKNGGGSGAFADLNGDGKVNLVDFSILLFYWSTPGPIGDLNNDKKVNLTDFSILLFNWTG